MYVQLLCFLLMSSLASANGINEGMYYGKLHYKLQFNIIIMNIKNNNNGALSAAKILLAWSFME